MARTTSGNVNTRDIQKRRDMSSNSDESSSSSAAAVIGSNAMPHFGHVAGWSCTTSGCIGQVYIVLLAGGIHAGFRSNAVPHFGQLPGSSDSMPGHIGQ